MARLAVFRLARGLVAYSARADEIDPTSLVTAGRALGQSVYFPRVVEPGLVFVAPGPGVPLAAGAYGILEPVSGTTLCGPAEGIVFLVPGVGFDPSGARLGRGGGHYDRALARHPAGVRIGMIADAELAPSVPTDPWDVPMDFVVSERRVLRCGAAEPSRNKENRQ